MSNLEQRKFIPHQDNLSYEKRLHTLSSEIIPVFHTEEYPTLESFVSPIFEESLAASKAIADGEMTVSSIDKNLIIVVGAPGSGKTHVVDELHKMREKIEFPDQHFRPFSWEGAEDEVKVNFTEAEKAETYFSDKRMNEVNKVAITQLDNAGSWILGIGEYAPVATKIELGMPSWMGKDAGATFLEYVVQNRPDIKVHVVGLCPESRVVRLATPFRNRGASPEAVNGYRQKSIRLALAMHDSRKTTLPSYMVEMLRRTETPINPLKDEKFNSIFAEPINEFVNVLVKNKRRGKGREGYIRGYNQLLAEAYTTKVARDDVISLASLYMYQSTFQSQLHIPEKNIFLGVSNPNIKKLMNAPINWDKVF